MRRIFAILITLGIISILLLGLVDLPPFAEVNTPANNEVVRYYIENNLKDTGALNILCSIILDYRGFDTFIESSVLFTSAIAVLIILWDGKKAHAVLDEEIDKEIATDTIARTIIKIVNPFIQAFAIYVMLNGHLSPGGGFSGGTILGVTFILWRLFYDRKTIEKKLSYSRLTAILCAGIILYGLVKGYSFFTGGAYLHWPEPPTGQPGRILSGAYLLPLNIFVGIVVANTMYFFYSLFEKGDI